MVAEGGPHLEHGQVGAGMGGALGVPGPLGGGLGVLQPRALASRVAQQVRRRAVQRRGGGPLGGGAEQRADRVAGRHPAAQGDLEPGLEVASRLGDPAGQRDDVVAGPRVGRRPPRTRVDAGEPGRRQRRLGGHKVVVEGRGQSRVRSLDGVSHGREVALEVRHRPPVDDVRGQPEPPAVAEHPGGGPREPHPLRLVLRGTEPREAGEEEVDRAVGVAEADEDPQAAGHGFAARRVVAHEGPGAPEGGHGPVEVVES